MKLCNQLIIYPSQKICNHRSKVKILFLSVPSSWLDNEAAEEFQVYQVSIYPTRGSRHFTGLHKPLRERGLNGVTCVRKWLGFTASPCCHHTANPADKAWNIQEEFSLLLLGNGIILHLICWTLLKFCSLSLSSLSWSSSEPCFTALLERR